MPNDESEGPNLPPKKNTLLSRAMKENVKCIELKGILAMVAVGFIVISYVIYNYYYYNMGVKLNELNFVSTGVGISIFTGLLFTFFQNVYVRTVLLFTCAGYAILETIYIIQWILFGNPYAYLKVGLVVGLIIGLIYFVYDRIKYRKSANSN